MDAALSHRGGGPACRRRVSAVAGVLLLLVACSTPAPKTAEAPSSTGSVSGAPASTAPASTAPASTGGAAEVAVGPVCDDGLLPGLAAIDAVTGEFRWTYCSADLAWREIRGATEDVVYVDATAPDPSGSSGAGSLVTLVAVDAVSGAELWQLRIAHPTLGRPAGPIAGRGVVVVEVESADGDATAIVGVDARTGDELWRATASDLRGTTDLAPGLTSRVSPLATTEGIVVVSVPAGLVGLDRTSGEQVWSSEVLLFDDSGVSVSRAAAAVDGSTVILPAASEVATAPMPAEGPNGGCCVAPDGSVLCAWPGGAPHETAPGADSPPCDVVTVPVGPSRLIAVDGMSGEVLWQGPRIDHPTAADGVVVGNAGPTAGPTRELTAVDAATGDVLWSRPGSASYGELWAVGDGAVYVNVRDDPQVDIVAYEAGTGDERWRRHGGVSVPSDPQQVADGAVVLLWDDLAALSTLDGTTRWTVPASVAPGTPMSSVGHDAASVFVSFNSQGWAD